MAAVRWEGININLTLSLFCFQIQCIDYGQRQAKVSVVAAAALKHHVSTLGGQRWDTLTHPLVWMEFWTAKMWFGRQIRSVDFEEARPCEWRVPHEWYCGIPFGIETPCGVVLINVPHVVVESNEIGHLLFHFSFTIISFVLSFYHIVAFVFVTL